MTGYIQPASHEFSVHYNYAEPGLAPYFAADSIVKASDGSRRSPFTIDGERWIATLSFTNSGIVHPGSRLPTGTEWKLDTIREFELTVRRHPEEDPIGQQSFYTLIRPRWQGMQGERGDGNVINIPVPPGISEGINTWIQGSNIAFHRYLPLLKRAASAVGIRAKYFDQPHESSNVQDAERYVRVHKDASGPIHARDGPISSMAHLLETDRQGFRKLVQNDNDGHGKNLPGYYHTVTLGPRRIREAFPTHALPKEIKHYYAREASNQPEDSPLAHPKLGVSYQANRWDETLSASPDDLEQLEQELDQTLLSVLADAGLDINPSRSSGPYVTDAYFEPKIVESSLEPIALDLTEIQSSQESVVVRHLADGLSPVQWESLQTLVSDGGDVSPADIAIENDRHVESVRRALRNIDDLVEREYAKVSLRSTHIAEMVHDAIKEAQEATKRAVEAGSKAIEAANRGMGEQMSVFVAWAAKHGVDVDDAISHREARMTLRFGQPGRETRRAIREGYRIWKDAGLPAERYRSARIRFNDGSASTAWHYLNPD